MISRILNRRNLGLNNKFYTRNIYNSFKNLNNQVNNGNDSQGFQTLDESRKKFEFKYADKLSKRVKEEGVGSLDELKQKVNPPQPKPEPTNIEQSVKNNHNEEEIITSSNTDQPVDKLKVDTGKDEYFIGSVDKVEGRKEGDGSGVKPLSGIIDIEKMKVLPGDHIAKLWNSHHASKDGFLSATIPIQTYKELYEQAKKYPSFVIPIPREIQGENLEQKTGYETFYVEWGFLPKVNENELNVRPTTLIMTSLNEYKQRQMFAQPFVACTHYVEFGQDPHNFVLMRGEVTRFQSNSDITVLDSKDAHLLLLTMQRFYLAYKLNDEGSKQRQQLLHNFHNNQSAFDFNKLCDLVQEL